MWQIVDGVGNTRRKRRQHIRYTTYAPLSIAYTADDERIVVLVVVVAFHDLKFCLSSQLKAASCARFSFEKLPSKQVNRHPFTTRRMICCSPQSQRGEASYPHSCMLTRHGPATLRNLFSRLRWPRGRSIPCSWLVWSLI